MPEANQFRSGEAAAVDDARVIQLVADDGVVPVEERRDRRDVGDVPAREGDGCLGALDRRDARLEAVVQRQRSGQQAHAVGAGTERVDRVLRRAVDRGMADQAQVRVAAEHEHVAMTRDPHARAAGHDLGDLDEMKIEALLLVVLDIPGAAGHRLDRHHRRPPAATVPRTAWDQPHPYAPRSWRAVRRRARMRRRPTERGGRTDGEAAAGDGGGRAAGHEPGGRRDARRGHAPTTARPDRGIRRGAMGAGGSGAARGAGRCEGAVVRGAPNAADGRARRTRRAGEARLRA